MDKNVLDNSKQAVVINGITSDGISVLSDVTQDSVLGLIHFLAYINELHEQVKVRQFADHTAMFLAISSRSLSEICILQEDFAKLELWKTS